MKIVVYGATGMVGSQIVEAALARGHEVTAVTRQGTAVPGATAVAAELADTATLTALAADADAVVLSVPPDRTGGPAQPTIDAHRAIIAARPATRLVVVGGAGSLLVGDGLLVDSAGFPDAYRPEALAFTQILADYRASEGLDWTLVSPSPMIGPGERSGYLVGTDSPVGDAVTTPDFADAILDEIESPSYTGRRFTVASKN